ncbi:MAG: hypothetical protein M3R24_37530 [Chloroflexota bacterium]|nr:hypothetical protein [Chloroflexota bacterium]
MNLPHIPSPRQAVAEIDPIIPVLYQGLESGTLHAREYFEQQSVSADPHLYAHLVRYRAKLLFAEYKAMATYVTEDLSLNGLMIHFSRYYLRILKSDHGEVPSPGQSKARQRFYAHNSMEQLLLPFKELEAEKTEDLPINLLVIWDITPSHNLRTLELVCPSNGDLSADSVSVYWRCFLPHPAEGSAFSTAAPSPSHDDTDDLDISLPNEEASSSQTG